MNNISHKQGKRLAAYELAKIFGRTKFAKENNLRAKAWSNYGRLRLYINSQKVGVKSYGYIDITRSDKVFVSGRDPLVTKRAYIVTLFAVKKIMKKS